VSQFLRPDSNVTQTNFTGGYTAIDESSPSDADKAYANAENTTCVLEVGLSNPSGTPGVGTATARYRYAKTDLSGVENLSGFIPTLTVGIYQGATLITSQSAPDPAAMATQTWTPDLSGVTDWTNVRARFTVGTTRSVKPSTPSQRGVAITWFELEVPDSVPGIMAATEAKDVFAAVGVLETTGSFAATEARDAFAGAGNVQTAGSMAATEAPDTFFAEYPEIELPTYGSPFICMRCGFRCKGSELRKEWTGARVCNACWDPKPEDLKPPRIKPEGVPKRNSSPEPEPRFVAINEITRDDL